MRLRRPVQPEKDYVLQVIPAYQGEVKKPVSLIAAMHSLVLDTRHPLALEIVGNDQQRSFLLRARSQMALAHAMTQLRARVPHVQFRALSADDDPFVLREKETVSVVELEPGAAAYLPLQGWDEQDFVQEGRDPLFGILGALDALPEGTRALTQLAVVPAAPDWSKNNQRKAIEHALEPEREAKRAQLGQMRQQEHVPSLPLLLVGGLLLLGIVNSQRIMSILPVWFTQAVWRQMHGLPVTLSPAQQVQYYGSLWGSGCLAFLLFVFGDQIRRRLVRTKLYDAQLARQQTMHMAYRVRLRLYVFSAKPSLARAIPGRNAQLANRRDGVFLQWYRSWMASWSQRRRMRGLQREQLARLIGAYRQFHLSAGNYFVPRYLSQRRARLCVGVTDTMWGKSGWWHGVARSRHFMSVETLAVLWHLPISQALPHLARMEHQRSRTLPMPLSLEQEGETRSLGTASHAGHVSTFAMPKECLQTHLFIAGKSGEGKSTCMEHLAREAMDQGGVVVIDPHGDLVEHILRLVPPARRDDVVLVDVSDIEYAVGFNPLDATLGRGRDKAVSDLLKTLAHIWASSWGPRMENAFEYALRTLFEANKYLLRHEPYHGAEQQYTLLDVMPVLTSESFCHSLLEQIEDPFILRWWNLYYDPLSLTMQRDRSDPVLSKVAKFESVIARRILGQSQSSLDIAQCIRGEKIVLVKLAKGVVGDDVARLLGSTLLGLVQITLEEQGALLEAQRKRLCILVDEFQLFKGVDWPALAELRKYGATFVLATQSPEYLLDVHEQLLPIVLANIKQYMLFHLSARDADLLKREIGVEAEDIVSLERYMCYAKLLYQGQRLPAFSLQMAPPPQGDEAIAQYIRQDCRRRYGRAVAVIDQALQAAMVRTIALPRKQRPDLVSVTQILQHTDDAMIVQDSVPGQVTPDENSSLTGIRQRTGYRGRKSQDAKKSEQRIKRQQHQATPMDWQETMGTLPVATTKDQEHDNGFQHDTKQAGSEKSGTEEGTDNVEGG